MPRKPCDPTPAPVDPVPAERGCLKCGVEMEPIETGPEGPPVEDLQLCPACYLVTWSDQDGMHVRQGVPVKKGANPPSEPPWGNGKTEEC